MPGRVLHISSSENVVRRFPSALRGRREEAGPAGARYLACCVVVTRGGKAPGAGMLDWLGLLCDSVWRNSDPKLGLLFPETFQRHVTYW